MKLEKFKYLVKKYYLDATVLGATQILAFYLGIGLDNVIGQDPLTPSVEKKGMTVEQTNQGQYYSRLKEKSVLLNGPQYDYAHSYDINCTTCSIIISDKNPYPVVLKIFQYSKEKDKSEAVKITLPSGYVEKNSQEKVFVVSQDSEENKDYLIETYNKTENKYKFIVYNLNKYGQGKVFFQNVAAPLGLNIALTLFLFLIYENSSLRKNRVNTVKVQELFKKLTNTWDNSSGERYRDNLKSLIPHLQKIDIHINDKKTGFKEIAEVIFPLIYNSNYSDEFLKFFADGSILRKEHVSREFKRELFVCLYKQSFKESCIENFENIHILFKKYNISYNALLGLEVEKEMLKILSSNDTNNVFFEKLITDYAFPLEQKTLWHLMEKTKKNEDMLPYYKKMLEQISLRELDVFVRNNPVDELTKIVFEKRKLLSVAVEPLKPSVKVLKL